MTISAEAAPFSRALPALLLLALATAMGFAAHGSFATVQESAKADLAFNDYQLGIVQGGSAGVSLLLLSIPIGVVVDRWRRVRLLRILALTWIAGTLLTAFGDDLATLFIARMMTAIGMTGTQTAALSLAADLRPPKERGRAVLIVALGKIAGQAAAFALVGWLFGQFVDGIGVPIPLDMPPWRLSQIALAAIALALVPLLMFLREPPRHEVEAGIHLPFRTLATELWARRAFLLPMFAGQASILMADAAAVIWAVPILSRKYGLQPDDFAAWMGLVMIASGVLGALIGGMAADAGQLSGKRGGLLLGAVLAAAVGVPAALFPLSPNVLLFGVALGILILCGTLTGLIMSVALTVLMPNELRGLCISAFIAVGGLIGFGIAPTLVALASDLLGGEQQLAPALALVGTTVSILGLCGFAMAMRYAPDPGKAVNARE